MHQMTQLDGINHRLNETTFSTTPTLSYWEEKAWNEDNQIFSSKIIEVSGEAAPRDYSAPLYEEI